MSWRATLTASGRFSLINEETGAQLLSGESRLPVEETGALLNVIAEVPAMLDALTRFSVILTSLCANLEQQHGKDAARTLQPALFEARDAVVGVLIRTNPAPEPA